MGWDVETKSWLFTLEIFHHTSDETGCISSVKTTAISVC